MPVYARYTTPRDVVGYWLVHEMEVPVKIGPSDLTHTVIESGLEEGAVVIVGPYKVLEGLQHDQAVKDEKAAATTQPATQPVLAAS